MTDFFETMEFFLAAVFGGSDKKRLKPVGAKASRSEFDVAGYQGTLRAFVPH
jgi:hypothetical protein